LRGALSFIVGLFFKVATILSYPPPGFKARRLMSIVP
jgi:hypothetical protein